MKFESYWLETAPAFETASNATLPAHADVVIVGGGFTGLSAARAFARSGAQVLVLDAGRLLGGASGRNGGQCNNGLAVDYAGLSARLGPRAAQDLSRAFDDAVDTVERIVETDRIACRFARTGKLKLAAKPAHFDKMTASVANIHEADPTAILLDASSVRDEVGSDMFHGGILFPRSASMHMGEFGVGLATAASTAGAQLIENTAVLSLERTGARRHRVTTARGTVDADMVLVATGASAINPSRFMRRRLVPVGSFIIVTEILPPELAVGLMTGRRNCTTTKHIGNYFRMTADGRLLFGGRARFAMSNRRSDEKSGHILHDGMARVFPSLRDVRVDYCWGGVVDMTQDRLPRAGEHDGLFYAAGYSGHGVQMSVHLGEVMTDVMRGRPERNPFRDLAWPAIPAHTGRPWFLPVVGAYYRARDLVE